MNTFLSNYFPKAKRILTIAIFTMLMSQIRLDLYSENFIVSFGPICIPLFIYLFDKVNIIATSFVSAILVFLMRLLIHFVQYGSISHAAALYSPEIGFYVVMGILLYIFDQIISHKRKLYIYIPGIMFIDYFCNNLDLFMRIQLHSTMMQFQWVLIVIAFVRGLVLLVLLVSLDKYRIMLFTKSHAQRYHRLIMLMSQLSGEKVWMNKNIDQIEKTMSTSYNLYNSLQAEGNTEKAKQALSVSKDIHEIKKEYRLISRGISEAIQGEMEDAMEISELFTILVQSIQKEISNFHKRLLVVFDIKDKLYVKEPYWFLSVFRNLISNALEASEDNVCTMQIEQFIDDSNVVFSISDNGPGISLEYAAHIFEPRFSTKVDYDTGLINRGLGLPIVKGIVEENLGGTVSLVPSNRGAQFIITIPKDKMEVVS